MFRDGWSTAFLHKSFVRTSFLVIVISVAVAVRCEGSVGNAWSSLAAYFSEAVGFSAASVPPKQHNISD